MSEEELNEAMQYNLDYTEAMLNDELFGTNEVAEVKLLASEKTIKDLQQKVEQLEKENASLKEANNYLQEVINSIKEPENAHHYHLENIKLRAINNQLENIRKEVIEYIKDNACYSEGHCKCSFSQIALDNLLNILNKGENNE